MTVSFEIRICDLLPELLANALVLLGPLQAARAISAGSLQPLTDGLDHFFIFVQPHCHKITTFLHHYTAKSNRVNAPIF